MVLLGLPVHLVFDFLMALALNVRIRGLALYRTVFYLPSITPVVAATIVWLWIFNGQYGILSSILGFLGLPSVGFLTDPEWTKPSMVFMGLWFGGNTILIYLAGLRDVPAPLLESAELDGAGAWRKTWHITMPMISPLIFYTLVSNVIGYFQYFTEAWVLTAQRDGAAGGPANSLHFYAMYLYQAAFQQFRIRQRHGLAAVPDRPVGHMGAFPLFGAGILPGGGLRPPARGPSRGAGNSRDVQERSAHTLDPQRSLSGLHRPRPRLRLPPVLDDPRPSSATRRSSFFRPPGCPQSPNGGISWRRPSTFPSGATWPIRRWSRASRS